MMCHLPGLIGFRHVWDHVTGVMEPEQPRITDELVQAVRQAARDLETKGWAVVPSLFSPQECDQLLFDQWTALEAATLGELNPHWSKEEWAAMKADELPPHQHGIMTGWRLNHCEPVRRVRRDPRCLFVFASLYGTDQLCGSLDRINFKFPGRLYRSVKPWPHVDQNPRRLGRVTVQSYVTMMDAPEDAPSNRLYEGSHALFAERWAYRRTGDTSDWTTLSEEEAAALERVCPLVKPVLRKGDMLLWDSRTVHSPCEGTSREGRYVIYLCYNRWWDKTGDARAMLDKQRAFLDCRATSHSPLPQKCFPNKPRQYGSAPVKYAEFDKQLLSIEDEPRGGEKYLFGFEAYGGEGQLLGADWRERYQMPEAGLLHFVSPFAALEPPGKQPLAGADAEAGEPQQKRQCT